VQNWVVFAKSPFGNFEYLGRYTHKIAISNHRIQNVPQQEVTFSYKDYRQNGIWAIEKEISCCFEKVVV
jgi:hypothetical protein